MREQEKIRSAATMLRTHLSQVGEVSVSEKRRHAAQYARECGLEITESREGEVNPTVAAVIAAADAIKQETRRT